MQWDQAIIQFLGRTSLETSINSFRTALLCQNWKGGIFYHFIIYNIAHYPPAAWAL